MAMVYDEAFVTVWKLAESLGVCDEAFGTEFYRVYGEWQAAGKPVDMLQFIRRRANTPAVTVKPREGDGGTVSCW